MNEHGTIRDDDMPELVWPEDPNAYARCADAYTRTMAFDLTPRPRARRRWARIGAWLAMGAVGGAAAAVIGLSLGHAYTEHESRLTVPSSSVAPPALPPGAPVVYPTDLGGLLNAVPDQACAPGPEATIAPCDRP